MKFCPKCSALLIPRKDSKGTVLACPNCRYVDKTAAKSPPPKLSQVVTAKEVPIVNEEMDDTALPTTDAKCEKCGNSHAYYWLIQTRASDEPETKFLKCTQCKHVWRDYN